MEEPKLKFKPITEGLGFHPFSDGLPYAPQSPQAKKTMGTGAVAAGPAKIVLPQQKFVKEAKPAPAAVVQPPAFQKSFIEARLNMPSMLYPLKRVMAFVLDTVFHLSLAVIALYGLTTWLNLTLNGTEPKEFFVVAALLFAITNSVLTLMEELLFGSSMGGKIMGLELQGGAGKILLRGLLFPLNILTLGLGLLMMFFDDERRALHDRISGLRPIEK